MTMRSGIGPILRSPFTWLALLVCILFDGSFWVWFEPPWMVGLASVAVAAGVFSLWPVFYVRSDQYVKTVFGLGEELEGAEARSATELMEEFKRLGFGDGGDQVQTLRQKYRNLADVLGKRLDAGELTYRRYLGMAESVYLAAMENLRDVAITLRSISTIDPAALQLRIQDLRKEVDFPVPEAIRAIEERRRLYEEQRQQIAKLLSQTEAAMTALDHTTAALARTRTSKGSTDVGIEEAMKALVDMAGRTDKYAAENV